MSKHTPGPWEVIGKTTAQGGPLFVESICKDEHVGPICEIRSNLKYPGCSQEDANGRKANARLIAAAPCLLDVCQRLLEAVPYVSEYDVPLGLWDDLRVAITKATGGTQ